MTRLPKRECHRIITAIFGTIADGLSARDELTLVGFGRFWVRYQPVRPGYSPKLRGAVSVLPKWVPEFTPAPRLQARVDPERGRPAAGGGSG